MRIDVVALAVEDQLPALTVKFPGQPELGFCALLLAIRRVGFDASRVRNYRSAGGANSEIYRQVRKSRTQNLKARRSFPKCGQIMRYWSVVVELKEDGAGFGVISKYLIQ